MRPIEESLCGDQWVMIAPDGRTFAARVPGCAHLDLQRAGVIAEVDAPGGEEGQAWVGRSAFSWRRSFRVSPELRAHGHVDLVFQSIDTVAEVFIDGTIAATVANHFHPHRIDLTERVAQSASDHAFVIEVRCAAPVVEVERIERELGNRPVNGDWTPYVFMRKPACDFGWDWGPRAPSSGIVDLVFLHGWSGSRIASVRPLVTRCTAADACVEVFVDTICDGDTIGCEAHVELESPDGRLFHAVAPCARSGIAHCVIEIPNPQRWWPRGYGAQQLQRLTVELSSRGVTHARWNGRIGLRSVALDTTPEIDGTRFAIRVNDQLIWCAGANWIPEGLNRMDAIEAKVRERLLQACEAHLVMLRVWGGGGYESDFFYGQCDELGLLVWQDFAFACATYPEEMPFPVLVEAEARFQLARLASHPSVVLWCGGNEDILAWYSWGFRDRLAAGQSWGRHYWLELLPRLCTQIDPTRPYWPESPWSGSLELHPNDPMRGDRHTWDATAKVEGLRAITPRFCSEFGHQSPPALASIAHALRFDERDIASLTPADGCAQIVSRQRATGADDAQYGSHLSDRFAPPEDFATWIAQAQSVQAKAMRIAYTWLRANRPHCSGALVWQMNDAWTGHSWSLVDAQGRAKPAWHAVRAACAPRMISIHARDEQIVVEAVNDTAHPWKSRITLEKSAHVAAGDPAQRSVRRVFEEGFTIEPWCSGRVLTVPAEFIPDATSILFAESPSEIRSDPIATAWYASGHEREMRAIGGSAAIPRAIITWATPPIERGGRIVATLLVEAASALVDAIVIPRGNWVSVEPMLFTLPAGRAQRIEVVWRSDAHGVDLFAAGQRIASA